MSNRKEELRKRIETDMAEFHKITEAETQEANSLLIGKCYKYRNSYSLPEEPDDYWWVYTLIVGAEGSSLKVFRFQTDRNGTIEIETDLDLPALTESYQEIGRTEFLQAWANLQKQIRSMSL